jgi:hypothetical protein
VLAVAAKENVERIRIIRFHHVKEGGLKRARFNAETKHRPKCIRFGNAIASVAENMGVTRLKERKQMLVRFQIVHQPFPSRYA